MPQAHHFAANPESVGLDPEKVEALLKRAEREVREGHLPAAQIAIARHGKIAAMRTFGSVTHEGRPAPATNETLFVAFSTTKAITSAAAWLLIQDGKLGLDELVADIIPEFGSNGKHVIRVEQLFTHTCGFPTAPYPQAEWSSREKRLERFGRWRLNWEPGSQFEYHATSSMWVVAELIERRSGIPYREFIRTRVAQPLDLPDLWVGLPRELHGRVADIEYRGEAPSPEQLRKLGLPVIPEGEVTEDAMLGFNEAAIREAGVPGGGAITTAGDLAIFYQALLDGRDADGNTIWKSEMLLEARRNRTGDMIDPWFGRPACRGLGVIIAGDETRVFRGFGREGSEETFGHNGAGGQVAWADPESGISLVYCTNGFDRDKFRSARRGLAISSLAAACAAADA